MERICPVCNGLTRLHERCSSCGFLMEDGGRVGEYATPYAPYFPDIDNLAGLTVDEQPDPGLSASEKEGYCAHLMTCPQCGSDKKVKVGLLDA